MRNFIITVVAFLFNVLTLTAFKNHTMRSKSSSSRSSGQPRGSLFGGGSSTSQRSIVPVSRSTPTPTGPKPVQKVGNHSSTQPGPSMFSTFASSAAGAMAGNALSNVFGGGVNNQDSGIQEETNTLSHGISTQNTGASPQSQHHPCAFEINQFIYCAENDGSYSCSRQWENFEQCHRQNPSWF